MEVRNMSTSLLGLETMLLAVGLCPTYRKYHVVGTLYDCFLKQTYPNKKLYIYDDGGVFLPFENDSVWLETGPRVHEPLPYKYNYMVERAIEKWNPDVLIVMEDDDIFLPEHFARYVHGIQKGYDYVYPSKVYSILGPDRFQEEPTGGRFHSSLGFSVNVFTKHNLWWPKTSEAAFDLILIDQLLKSNLKRYDPIQDFPDPTYIFRWMSPEYHAECFIKNPKDTTWYETIKNKTMCSYTGQQLIAKVDPQAAQTFEILANWLKVKNDYDTIKP